MLVFDFARTSIGIGILYPLWLSSAPAPDAHTKQPKVLWQENVVWRQPPALGATYGFDRLQESLFQATKLHSLCGMVIVRNAGYFTNGHGRLNQEFRNKALAIDILYRNKIDGTCLFK